MKKKLVLLFFCLATLMLAGCGGGDPTATARPSATISQTPTATLPITGTPDSPFPVASFTPQGCLSLEIDLVLSQSESSNGTVSSGTCRESSLRTQIPEGLGSLAYFWVANLPRTLGAGDLVIKAANGNEYHVPSGQVLQVQADVLSEAVVSLEGPVDGLSIAFFQYVVTTGRYSIGMGAFDLIEEFDPDLIPYILVPSATPTQIQQPLATPTFLPFNGFYLTGGDSDCSPIEGTFDVTTRIYALGAQHGCPNYRAHMSGLVAEEQYIITFALSTESLNEGGLYIFQEEQDGGSMYLTVDTFTVVSGEELLQHDWVIGLPRNSASTFSGWMVILPDDGTHYTSSEGMLAVANHPVSPTATP